MKPIREIKSLARKITRLRKFHCFPRLPTELQLRIWCLAIEDTKPRIVEFIGPCILDTSADGLKIKMGYKPRPPPYLTVCRNAREECLKKYSLFFSKANGRPVYFCFEKDVVIYPHNFDIEWAVNKEPDLLNTQRVMLRQSVRSRERLGYYALFLRRPRFDGWFGGGPVEPMTTLLGKLSWYTIIADDDFRCREFRLSEQGDWIWIAVWAPRRIDPPPLYWFYHESRKMIHYLCVADSKVTIQDTLQDD